MVHLAETGSALCISPYRVTVQLMPKLPLFMHSQLITCRLLMILMHEEGRWAMLVSPSSLEKHAGNDFQDCRINIPVCSSFGRQLSKQSTTESSVVPQTEPHLPEMTHLTIYGLRTLSLPALTAVQSHQCFLESFFSK